MKLFGTDGIRGIPGKHPFVPELIRKAAFASATLFKELTDGGEPDILVARDSRHSGISVSRNLQEGFTQAGLRTIDVGIIPTSAMARLTPNWGALGGVVVSASHNPPEFNGIKLFSPSGLKLEPQKEEEIEKRIRSLPPIASRHVPPPVNRHREAVRDYADFLRSTFPAHLDLEGMKIVIDCANGAASAIAPKLLRSLGATMFTIGCSPSGYNINVGCGALLPEAMRRAVAKHKADCGISLDGDADRAIFSDEAGRILDGDVLISMAGPALKEKGQLRKDRVVTTVMSNLALSEYLESRGISVVQVPVGDRNVTQLLISEDLSLGGESSGHVIFREFSDTGDGLLTALRTLAIIRESQSPLSYFRKRFSPFPQILKNIPVSEPIPLSRLPRFSKMVKQGEKQLGKHGRILVRYSGTEPFLRIMVEAKSRRAVRRLLQKLTKTFKAEAGEAR